MKSKIKTTAVFLQPFELEGFNEVLPAGEYEIEIETSASLDCIETEKWSSSVQVNLLPRVSYPGLSRALIVPLAELESAIAKDKLTGKSLTDFFLEEMLADPMICLVMQADGVSQEEVRSMYSGWGLKGAGHDGVARGSGNTTDVERREEMSPHPKFLRPAKEAKETRCRSMHQATVSECITEQPQDIAAVTARPIDLDGRRTPAGQLEAILRRGGANTGASPAADRTRADTEIDAAMLAGPTRTYVEVMERASFLLKRYSESPDGQDARIQDLIKHALVDLTRLKKHEENKL